ncbi:MAG: hypothetical protein JSS07_07425 [Proteobacteria bacterium]|nr:hypothetical protein [Pseudomonadota bacterium]
MSCKIYSEAQTNQQISPELFNAAKDEYKRLTSKLNELLLLETLNELSVGNDKNKDNDIELIDSLTDFCNQHLDYKKNNELKLLYEIIKGIPKHLQEDFVTKLSPQAQVILSYLNAKGIDTPFSEIPKTHQHHFYMKNPTSKNVPISINLNLEAYNAIDYAIILCKKYFKFIVFNEDFDLLLTLMRQLPPNQLYEIFVQENDAVKLESLLLNWPKKSENKKTILECITLIFKALTKDQKKSVPGYCLQFLYTVEILNLFLAGLNQHDIFEIYSKGNSNDIYPLSGQYDYEMLHLVNKVCGTEFFITLIKLSLSAKQSILHGHIFNKESFQYILNKLSNDELKEHLDSYKPFFGKNLIGEMIFQIVQLESSTNHTIALNIIENLRAFLNRLQQSDIYNYLTENYILNQIALIYAMKNNRVFCLLIEYFETEFLISILAQHNAINKIISCDYSLALPALESFLSPLQYKKLLTTTLENNIATSIKNCAFNILFSILKEANHQEVEKLFTDNINIDGELRNLNLENKNQLYYSWKNNQAKLQLPALKEDIFAQTNENNNKVINPSRGISN